MAAEPKRSKAAAFERLRQQAEALLADLPGARPGAHSDVVDLFRELAIYQAELELQNEELEEAQAELAALHRQYRDLYEFAPCGYVTLDARRVISSVNLTAAKLLERDRSALLRSTLGSFVVSHAFDRYLDALSAASWGEARQSVEVPLVTSRSTWVRMDVDAERDDEGRTYGWRVVLLDVTAQRAAEAARERVEARLRRSQQFEAIGRLAGGVAHDFNNVLQIIGASVALGRADTVPGSAACEAFDDISAASFRAADLVSQLLDYSRQQRLAPVPLALDDAVAAALAPLRRMLGEQHTLRFRGQGDLPAATVDPSALQRMLSNLLRNARDALPDGGEISIATGRRDFGADDAASSDWIEPGRYVWLSVADGGCGMTRETRARCVEPFFTTKGPGQGTGLGLATVEGLVRQQQGLLQIESRLGAGTTVTLYFPVSGAPADGEARPAAVAERTVAGETILFVDDEPQLRRLFVRLLERAGYRVVSAGDGEQALEAFAAHGPEIACVISDVVMPRMGGRELYERLTAQRPDLPFLFVSAFDRGDSVNAFLQAHQLPLLQKPVLPSELLARLRWLLAPTRVEKR